MYGPIPKELVLLQNLTHLDLRGNKFSGEFPFGSIKNGSKLQWLDISSNQFNGTIGEDAFRNLGELKLLDLSSNEFTSQPNLTSLNGSIGYLNMSRNKFEGYVPHTLSNFLSSLHTLDLSQNNFIDYLPEFIGMDSGAQINMNLSSNHFSNRGGRLTLEILSLAKWTSELYLDKNDLSGTLNVKAILESNASQNLNILSLKNNKITSVNSPNTSIFSVAIGLTRVILQGNPYCKKTWSSQHEIKTCNFYCANTCYNRTKPKMDRRILIMASSITSAVVVLGVFLLIVGFGFVLRGKEKYIQDLQKKINEAHVNAKRFDYNELRVATRNFAPDMKLGEGGYGAVYKGILASNVVVAVKQLLINTCASREEFVNEVLLISDLQHQNLVALKGYCLNDKQTLLVYEYVDNCDLGKLLLGHQATGESTSQGLDLWKTRLKICQGVAQGLHYLHTFSQSRIIHRDIKASNILVNENFEAKIADFGLARLIAGSVIETSRCAGTFGYLAPEYVSQGQLSEKADVYSFGVLLLEIVSGMRNNHDQRMPEDEMHLASWARKLQKAKRLLDMKDPTLIVSEDEAEEVQQVLETAVSCVQNDPKKRPPMDLVVAMLAVKSYDDALPEIDEELALEVSDSDVHPLFGWTASAPTSLAGRPTCNPRIELSSSKNARLWRARSLQHHLQSHVGDAM